MILEIQKAKENNISEGIFHFDKLISFQIEVILKILKIIVNLILKITKTPGRSIVFAR